jgi:hypothetical protein
VEKNRPPRTITQEFSIKRTPGISMHKSQIGIFQDSLLNKESSKMPDVPPSHLRASSLQFYPENGPADQNIVDAVGNLWRQGRSFVVLSGPPGVGKTRSAEDLIIETLKKQEVLHDMFACRLSKLFPNYQDTPPSSEEIGSILISNGIRFVWEICVLHPQFTYEDMIRGVRLVASSTGTPQLSVREGVLGFMSRVVDKLETLCGKTDSPRGILVLDEINRAPLGQLFGEAMYALDRRGHSVATPYNLKESGCTFSIPKSLLLLGTMNSVDRAVSGFDFALKRRFVTLTVGSRVQPIENRYSENSKVRSIAVNLYNTVSTLVKEASQSGVVPNSELVLGHSYFIAPLHIETEAEIFEWLGHSLQYQVIPTLIDYAEQGLLQYSRNQLESNQLGKLLEGSILVGELDAAHVQELLKSFDTSASTQQDVASQANDL